MGMVAAFGPGAIVNLGGPWALMSGVVGAAGESGPQAFVAGPSPTDVPGLVALAGGGGEAWLGGKLVIALEVFAQVTELGEDLSGADPAGPGEGHQDLAVGQFGDLVRDAAGDLSDLGHEVLQSARQGAQKFSLGLALGFADAALRDGLPAHQQHLGRFATTVMILGEEAGQTLGSKTRGGNGYGITLDEGECDGTGYADDDSAGGRRCAEFRR
jgi:hypothetical protein